MRDIFNRRQRFSVRKYSFGVCSVLLGTALFAAGSPVVSADEVAPTTDATSNTVSDTLDQETNNDQSESRSGESSVPSSYDVTAAIQPSSSVPAVESTTTESKESVEDKVETEKEVADTNVAPTEASSPTGTTGFRNGGEVTSRVVSNWNGFVSALNDSSIKNITISGNVVATGDNGNVDNGRVNSVDRTVTIASQGRNLVIQGRNDQSSLDLLSNTLKFTGSSAWNLVFKNLQLATGNSKELWIFRQQVEPIQLHLKT